MHNIQTSFALGKTLKEFNVCVKPDHPLLFAGPDVLVGHNGKLWGIFVPRKSEYKDYQLLYTRIINSKLAYPNNFFTIIYTEEKFINLIERKKFSRWGVNHILDQRDKKNLKSIINNDNSLMQSEKFFEEVIKKNVTTLYGIIYSDLYFKISKVNYFQRDKTANKKNENRKEMLSDEKNDSFLELDNSSELVTEVLSSNLYSELNENRYINLMNDEKKLNLQNNIKFKNDYYIAKDKFGSVIQHQLESYTEDIFKINTDEIYTDSLDSFKHKGILYVNSEKVKSMPHDPLKIFRAMAFSGIYVHTPKLKFEINDTIGKMQDLFKRSRIQ